MPHTALHGSAPQSLDDVPFGCILSITGIEDDAALIRHTSLGEPLLRGSQCLLDISEVPVLALAEVRTLDLPPLVIDRRVNVIY